MLDACVSFLAAGVTPVGVLQTTANWVLETGPENLQRQQQLWMREADKEAEAREAAKHAEKEARKMTLAKCAPCHVLDTYTCPTCALQHARLCLFLNKMCPFLHPGSLCNRKVQLHPPRRRGSRGRPWSRGQPLTKHLAELVCVIGTASLYQREERNSSWKRSALIGMGDQQAKCIPKGSEGRGLSEACIFCLNRIHAFCLLVVYIPLNRTSGMFNSTVID